MIGNISQDGVKGTYFDGIVGWNCNMVFAIALGSDMDVTTRLTTNLVSKTFKSLD
jgi:hypothetical protein